MSDGLKINLGSGPRAVPGWVNVDGAPGARLAKLPLFPQINRRLRIVKAEWSREIFVHDLRKPLPWADGAVDCIYSSHTLEHLEPGAGAELLRECHRVLGPEGVIRFVVPDLRQFLKLYEEGSIRASEFIVELGVLPEPGMKARLTQFPHRCLYDAESLDQAMSSAGFTGGSLGPRQSELPNIDLLEKERNLGRSLIFEGRPAP